MCATSPSSVTEPAIQTMLTIKLDGRLKACHGERWWKEHSARCKKGRMFAAFSDITA